MRIKVDSTALETRAGTSKRSGKPYSLLEQTAWVELPNGERRRVKFVVQAAYAPGVYELADESFMVDQYGNLAVGRLSLKPVVSAAGAASARG